MHHGEKSHLGCFSCFSAQGSTIPAFNPVASKDMCCIDSGSLPQSVSQCWWQLRHLHLQQINMLKKYVNNNATSAPEIADF